MAHQAQDFAPHLLLNNAFTSEEGTFNKSVSVLSSDNVPLDANVIYSHTVYKLKVEYDGVLKLKDRIATHGNEDSVKYDMRSDCAMCASICVRMLLAIATLCRWCISKTDVNAAFLQTGPAKDASMFILQWNVQTSAAPFGY